MAFLLKFMYVLLLVALCFVVMVFQQSSSDCSSKIGCLYPEIASQQIHSRKVHYGWEEEKVVFKRVEIVTSRGNIGKQNVRWELRETPSGPDPLHHHGGTPNKPSIKP